MAMNSDGEARPASKPASWLLTGATHDFDPLMDRIGEARFVLLGTASHGTQEFHAARAEITRRLIEEKDFAAVAVDADWVEARRVDHYVRGLGDDRDATDALDDFRHFPAWLWRNAPVRDFVEWLKSYNQAGDDSLPETGFYGLDLYNYYGSIQKAIRYLEEIDPPSARRARVRYVRSDHFGEGDEVDRDSGQSRQSSACEDEVVRQLLESQSGSAPLDLGTRFDRDHDFYAAQQALLAPNAERFYRKMFGGHVSWWNLRNRHMMEMLQDLAEHLGLTTGRPKVVVWAHNLNLGDARATHIAHRRGLSVGQFVRQRHGRDAVLVGLTTYAGTVRAASEWDAPGQPIPIEPAIPGSYERLFHDMGHRGLMLSLRGAAASQHLQQQRLERSIGVIALPESHRANSYFHARLPDQFDVVIHLDRTTAVQPLDRARSHSRDKWATGMRAVI